jgi:tripartite-type tricarboxylate transporter receptor subunit TctC
MLNAAEKLEHHLGREGTMRQNTMTRRRAIQGIAAAAVLSPLAAQASWRPTKVVRIVVPYAAGGITDIMARLLAAHLQTRWNQSVIVDNKTGASGIIGTVDALRSPPDGHTLLLGNTGPQAIAYSLFRNLPYKPADLAAVSSIITGSNLLIVDPNVPVSNLSEFIEWLRSQKGKASYAISGAGGSTHLSATWFLRSIGAEATSIPYRGSAPAVQDVIAGQVSFYFDNLANGMEFVRGGRVKGLGVTSAEPSPYTDIPPICRALPELKDYDVTTFYGIFVPSAVDQSVVEEVNSGIKEFLSQESTRKYLAQWASTAAWTTPKAADAFVAAEIAKWTMLVEREGLKLDIN